MERLNGLCPCFKCAAHFDLSLRAMRRSSAFASTQTQRILISSVWSKSSRWFIHATRRQQKPMNHRGIMVVPKNPMMPLCHLLSLILDEKDASSHPKAGRNPAFISSLVSQLQEPVWKTRFVMITEARLVEDAEHHRLVVFTFRAMAFYKVNRAICGTSSKIGNDRRRSGRSWSNLKEDQSKGPTAALNGLYQRRSHCGESNELILKYCGKYYFWKVRVSHCSNLANYNDQ